MSIYKLTCSESGKVYYGSTKKSIEDRKSKGWYACSCKDFVNPTIECVEKVNDLSCNNLRIREDDWIRNNECVNKNGAIYKINRKLKAERNRRYFEKIIKEKKHHCKLCDLSFRSSGKLERHLNGYRCKLKQKSYEKYGDNWKDHYLSDNRKRYKETRRIKKD